MLNVAHTKSGTLAVGLALLLAACAAPRTQEDTRATVDAAEVSVTNFRRDPDMTWLQRNLPKAKALMVCPKVLQAGFIVGASGGRCVVLARSHAASQWNGPAFYRISTGSFGLQAGAQASELIALIMTEKALNSLLSTSFKLGGDVSVAAGPIGAGTGAPITADVVSFVRSKGLYAGVNLDGSVITIEEEGNQAFYGRPASPVNILIEGSAHSSSAASLVRAIEGPGS